MRGYVRKWRVVIDVQRIPIWKSSDCVSARRSISISSRTGRALYSLARIRAPVVPSWTLSVR